MTILPKGLSSSIEVHRRKIGSLRDHPGSSNTTKNEHLIENQKLCNLNQAIDALYLTAIDAHTSKVLCSFWRLCEIIRPFQHDDRPISLGIIFKFMSSREDEKPELDDWCREHYKCNNILIENLKGCLTVPFHEQRAKGMDILKRFDTLMSRLTQWK